MAKQVVEANELTDLQVQRVSLVKRGANRIPFRITKGDSAMSLDLSKLFKSQMLAPTVTAVIVRKGADSDAAQAALAEAGFRVTTVETTDDATIYHQGNRPQDGEAVIKMDEDIAVVVTNVAKGFKPYDYSSADFAEALKVDGYYPSVYTACDALHTVIHKSLTEAKTPDAAATSIGAAIEDFKTYVTGLTASLPSNVFKLEKGYKEKRQDKTAETGVAKTEGGTDADGNVQSIAPSGQTPAPAGDPAPAPVAKSDPAPDAANDPPAPVAKTDGEAAVEPPAVEPPAADPAQTIAAMAALIGDLKTVLTEQIGVVKAELGAAVSAVDGKLGAVESRVAKTEHALGSTVLGDAGRDKTHVAKSDTGSIPLIDTAMSRRFN